MRGDINAIELYQDREFLTRLGYGIFDVEVGSTGGVGFEDVRRFTYLESEDEDPKLYRRKVFNLVNRYYPNEVAHVLWSRFNEYRNYKAEQIGFEINLEEAALEWLDLYGHEFFKNWALKKLEVPFRMRNQAEPRLGHLDVLASQLVPQWRELLECGFKLLPLTLAALIELKGGRQNHYLRLVARLSGHKIKIASELPRRLTEIEQLQAYLSQQMGRVIGSSEATIEYYRRLSLIAEIEGERRSTYELAGATAW